MLRTLASRLSFVAVLAAPAVAGDDFFLIDNTADGLFRSNTSAVGGDVLVATQSSAFWGDLCPANLPQHLYSNRVLAAQVVTLRESDGAVVNTLQVDQQIRSIAYDAVGDRLYGLPQNGASVDLVVIDQTSGATTVVGSTGIVEGVISTFALEFDGATGDLWATTASGNVYRIDAGTGAGQLVGSNGLTSAFGLAYNPADGQLYVSDASTDLLYTLDRATGSVAVVGGPFQLATLATGLSFSGSGGTGCGGAAVESVRLGTPPNPNAFLPGLSSGPVINAVWDPVVDHTTFLPGAAIDFAAVMVTPINVFAPPMGTVLCDPTLIVALSLVAPSTPFAIAIPNDCDLVGLTLCTQGGSLDLSGGIRLANALDITLGTF